MNNRYDVWDAHTDEIIMIDGTSAECADAMGVKLSSFYSIICRMKKDKSQKWYIEEHKAKPKSLCQRVCTVCGKKYKAGKWSKMCPKCRGKFQSDQIKAINAERAGHHEQ